MTTRLRRLARFAGRVTHRFVDDGCSALAGSLTFTTLFALVPLFTIALTLITAFPVFEQFTRGLDDYFARNLLPPAVAKTVTGHIEQFTASAAKLTAVGIAMLAVTAVLLMATIERAFDGIWRVARPRPIGMRLLMYCAVLTLGPLLIGAGLTMTSYLVTASLGLTRELPALNAFILDAAPVALTACAFTLVYFVVPNRRVAPAHAAIAGLLAAATFELMKRGFALYIAKFPSYASVYGAFAAVPLFLLWIYLSWVATLLGAVVAALLPDYGHDAPMRDSPGASFRAALEILRALIRTQPPRRALNTRSVLREARIGRDAGYRVLETLAEAGWVARMGGERWLLACDPDALTVAAVYRHTVFDPADGRYGSPDAALAGILDRAAAGAERSLDIPIRRLAEAAAAVR